MSTFFKIFSKKSNFFYFLGKKPSKRAFSSKKTTRGFKIYLPEIMFVSYRL